MLGLGEKGKLGVETRQEGEEGWWEWGQLQNKEGFHVEENIHSQMAGTHLI